MLMRTWESRQPWVWLGRGEDKAAHVISGGGGGGSSRESGLGFEGARGKKGFLADAIVVGDCKVRCQDWNTRAWR